MQILKQKMHGYSKSLESQVSSFSQLHLTDDNLYFFPIFLRKLPVINDGVQLAIFIFTKICGIFRWLFVHFYTSNADFFINHIF